MLKFTGLQSSARNVTTVDSKEKDALLKSKLVSQAKDQYARQASEAALKKAKSRVEVDTDAVGKALAQSKNIWKQMEKQNRSTKDVASPRKSKVKRKTLIQVTCIVTVSYISYK